MNVLKTPSFFRPSSRPSSPAPALIPPRPESSQGPERQSRPLNKLSLTNFIRQNSSQAPSPLPNHALLTQDGSYLEMLSLKLSEAVVKALAQPTGPPAINEQPSGKRPIPQGRGLALGALLASELNAVHDNSHLHRAVLRSLQRPFTVLLTNISGQLLPTLASPSFHAVPTVTNQFSFPNGVQLYALSIAKVCEELLQVFDQLGLGTEADIRGDGLKSIRDGLVSTINRVVNPLIASIRGQLVPLVEALENPNGSQIARLPPGAKSTIVYHPSIISFQSLMPIYARALTACTTSSLSHATLASLLISILWKAMIALSHRIDVKQSPLAAFESTPLVSPKKRRGSPASTTPPVTPPPGRFMIKLPPSRPPSPPPTITNTSAAADCKALYDLLVSLPRPSSDHGSTRLAREAVDEAFEGLRTLHTLLGAAGSAMDLSGAPDVIAGNIIHLTADIPTLVALPVILRAVGGPGTTSVAPMLGISDEEYRKACLSGFSRAEECTPAIVQRVMDVLQGDQESNNIVIRWLEMEMADTEDSFA
ncbi:hypothetical protein GALMADRAFT_547826 [Galerina marginata CBS 339.88]|uniref:Uncharacterized protein n=1 Tax=Galerina marginata (strain CBS 339.88) TaxID=685588 RepID=A0A067T5Y1_GALM3|nr:hypothetical protein GALMADRAFT_547826 [Galerina marginata CBS 339.88]